MKIFTRFVQIIKILAGIITRFVSFYINSVTTRIQQIKTVFMQNFFTLIKKTFTIIHYREERTPMLNVGLQPVCCGITGTGKIFPDHKSDVAENAASFAFIPQPNYSSEKKFFMKKSLRFATITLVTLVLLSAAKISDAQVTQPVSWAVMNNGTTTTAVTTTVTIPTSSTNRVLVVAITANVSGNSNNIADPTTVSYGGVSLTKLIGDGTLTNGARMHTWLYYLTDNAVMNGTAQNLTVTLGAVGGITGGSGLNSWSFFSGVFANVDQNATHYTSVNTNNNANSTSIALTTGLSIAANAQAIYVMSVYNAQTTGGATVPSFTVTSPWTIQKSDQSNGTTAPGWINNVANRTIPTTSVASDNASAGTVTPSSRYSISAMSLPQIPCTTPTAYNVTGGGQYCTGGSGVPVGLSNSQTGVNYQLFVNTGTGATATGSPVAGTTGSTITFGNQTVAGTYTVVATTATGGCTANMTGSVSVALKSAVVASVNGTNGTTNVTCNGGADGTIIIQASGGTAPYSFSVDNGSTWQASANNPYTYGGLKANTPYYIRVKDSSTPTACISASAQ